VSQPSKQYKLLLLPAQVMRHSATCLEVPTLPPNHAHSPPNFFVAGTGDLPPSLSGDSGDEVEEQLDRSGWFRGAGRFLPHPWQEWVDFMDTLVDGPKDYFSFESFADRPIDQARDRNAEFYGDGGVLKHALMQFSRDRDDLIRWVVCDADCSNQGENVRKWTYIMLSSAVLDSIQGLLNAVIEDSKRRKGVSA
jgi:hypothetical protein